MRYSLYKILMILSSCTFCLSFLEPVQAKEYEDHQYRTLWAKELTRWTAYCTTRSERSEPIFNGCGSRFQAIKATQSLFRRVRIDGFVHSGPPLVEAVYVQQWLNRQKKAGLTSRERSALIELAHEALQATGDLYWFNVLKQTLTQSIWFSGISCHLQDPCAVELLVVLKSMLWLQQKQAQLSQAPSITWSEQEAYIVQRIPALLAVAKYLSQNHPQGQLKNDQKRLNAHSLWALRAQLASLSLPSTEFVAWWKGEQEQFNSAQPVSEQTTSRFGLNFSRMMGLGSLLQRLKQEPKLNQESASKKLLQLYHTHAKQAMEVYLKHRRNYQEYNNPINAFGVIALSSELTEQDFAWRAPVKRWRYPQFQFKPEQLPQIKLQADGMFSKLAIKDRDTRRGMYFVRPNGQELLETEVDLIRPEFLQVRYTQDMLAVYPFFDQKPKRALLIGLGGGSMVHALHAYDPSLDLEVVEIDPVVVRFARDYFGIQNLETRAQQTDTKLKVLTADGFDYLKPNSAQSETATTKQRYDIIWMDAFLQPTSETDSTGSPLNLKTVEFLKVIRDTKLSQKGVLAININHHEGLKRDFDSIRAAFPASSIWQVPETGNYIALGFKTVPQQSVQQLMNLAKHYTQKQASPFNYRYLLERALENIQPSMKP